MNCIPLYMEQWGPDLGRDVPREHGPVEFAGWGSEQLPRSSEQNQEM